VSAVIDVVAKRPDVDADRIAIIGESFGGYLAPRAAARDRRIAACVLDRAQVSLFRAFLARVPVPEAWKEDLPPGPSWLVAALRIVLARMAKGPSVNDDISASAKAFFDALTCDKTYFRLTAAEGAADHCATGNRPLFHERAFDWLEDRFAQTETRAA
jgi:pimeloyl-ACP methyl ester carboxylesterase